MRTPLSFWHRLAACTAFALTITISLSNVRAAGVAVVKEQAYHRDSSAKPVLYLRIIDSHGPYLRFVNGDRNIDILRSKMVDRIEVPHQIPPSLMEEKDVASLREALVDLRNFAERYPLSAPLLEPPIGALSGHLARFDGGEVRFEGAWITRIELAAVLENRRLVAEKRRRHEIEQLVFNESQREKGLVLVDGKWMTLQDARERSPSARTGLSDSLWPLLNPDIEGARLVLQNLSTLAASQIGADKVRTQRLQRVIRNLFLAEFRLSKQIIAYNLAAAKAKVHGRHAMQWLQPNAFGTIREDAARESLDKALAVRSQAEEQLAACRAELLAQLREADIVTDDFHKLREHRVAMIIGEAVRTIAARRFPGGEFRSSFPDESLVAIRSSITSRK